MYYADSTVLAYVMKLLNERHKYGVELQLLSIDEGITGYRDDSLEVNDVSRCGMDPTNSQLCFSLHSFAFSEC